MRGFRPSRFSGTRELFEDSDRTKEDNVYRYMTRARRGLPLFERLDRTQQAENGEAPERS